MRTFGLMSGVVGLIAVLSPSFDTTRFARAALPDPSSPRFTVTPLGLWKYPEPYIVGFNAKGSVVGNVPSATSSGEAFFKAPGGILKRLGSVPSFALDVSDDDWVVGQSTPTTRTHAFLWTLQGGLKDLGTLPGGLTSRADAINNRHEVVGYSDSSSGRRAFIWDPLGGMKDLGHLPGGAGAVQAAALSESGQVVGHAYVGAGPNDYRPFQWTAESGMTGLGLLPGGTASGTATGVNSKGHVVGNTAGLATDRAFFWTEQSGAVDIGALPGFQYGGTALAINDDDWIVGISRNPGPSSAARPFFWTPSLGIHDLNELLDDGARDWELWEADRVDDAGRIFARGSLAGESYFVMLTPVPEPAHLAILAMIAVGLRRRRRFPPSRSLHPD